MSIAISRQGIGKHKLLKVRSDEQAELDDMLNAFGLSHLQASVPIPGPVQMWVSPRFRDAILAYGATEFDLRCDHE